jgi:hypothetical protein
MKITLGKRSRARYVISCIQADDIITRMHSNDLQLHPHLLYFASEITLHYHYVYYSVTRTGSGTGVGGLP